MKRDGGARPRLTLMTWQGVEKKTKQAKGRGGEAEAHVDDLAGSRKEDNAGKGTGARGRGFR